METTPLQLYKKAYDLHYRKNDVEQAQRLYTELVQGYSDSDASVYASIQLSKIQAGKPSKVQTDFIPDAVPRRRTSTGWPVIVLLIINLLLSTAIIVGFILHVQVINNRNESISKLMQSTGKLYVGRDEEALEILNELKIALREDITPYVISADIYCKKNDYMKARKEYEAFERLYPGNVFVRIGVKRVNKEEDRHIKETKRMQAVQDSLAKVASEEKVEKEPEPEPKRRIMRTDDITYF